MQITCTSCGEEKERNRENFEPERRVCRACRKKQHKKANLTYRNSAKGKAKNEAWRQANVDKIRSASRKNSHTVAGRFRNAKHSAKKRHKDWLLSLEEYTELANKPCHYCGNLICEPTARGIGLDRIDNTKGYYLENVLPCGGRCNAMRMDNLSVHETEILVAALLLMRGLI